MVISFSADIDAPISTGARGSEAPIDQSKVDTLIAFGFQEELARKALKASVSYLLIYFENWKLTGFVIHLKFL